MAKFCGVKHRADPRQFTTDNTRLTIRAGPLLPSRSQHALCLIERRIVVLLEINYLQLDCFVRDHSSGLKRFPLRRVVAVLTHRKLTTALHLLEARYAQHASAASAADNHRATAFLHNAGEQLRAATRAFVYQNRNRTLVNLLVIVGSKKQRSSRSLDELAERNVRAEEVACDLNYLLGFASRVAANVNHDG